MKKASHLALPGALTNPRGPGTQPRASQHRILIVGPAGATAMPNPYQVQSSAVARQSHGAPGIHPERQAITRSARQSHGAPGSQLWHLTQRDPAPPLLLLGIDAPVALVGDCQTHGRPHPAPTTTTARHTQQPPRARPATSAVRHVHGQPHLPSAPCTASHICRPPQPPPATNAHHEPLGGLTVPIFEDSLSQCPIQTHCPNF
eukprot:357052-Chlamydomonas_euryale.AAC.2